MWKVPRDLMAKPKADRENGASEHELVTMARGLAEIAAAHNLSELIVDTKETTLTIRRGGGGGAMAMAMPQMMSPMAMPQMQMPQMPQAGHAPPAAASAPAASDAQAHLGPPPFVGPFYPQ